MSNELKRYDLFDHPEFGLNTLAPIRPKEDGDYVLHSDALAAIEAARIEERKACADLCEQLKDHALSAQNGKPDELHNIMLRQVGHAGRGECASAIRLRGLPPPPESE